MKIEFSTFIFITFAVVLIIVSCDKKNDADNNNNNQSTTALWNLVVDVDLGSTFQVIATASITTTGSTFSAAVNTTQIAGAPEIHNATITGSVSSSTLTVTNAQFNVSMPNGTESVTINTATLTTSGNNMTGNGTITKIPAGTSTPQNGTFTLTGIKS